MHRYDGYFVGCGSPVPHAGGVKYSFIRIERTDGQFVTLADIVAFDNVHAGLQRALWNDDGKHQISLYTSDQHFIYAVEDARGIVHSDIGMILMFWILSMFGAFGPMVFTLLVFALGIDQMRPVGFLLAMVSLVALAACIRPVFRFWPKAEVRTLHKRSRHLRP